MKIAISSWANIDTDFLDFASKANIKIISFGIETGDTEILKFYRKNIDLQNAKQMIWYANSIGIFTIGNFIIGAPMETAETINETFSFIEECSFDKINIKNLDYMMGSELYSSTNTNITGENTHVFACKELGLTNFTIEELKNIKRSFVQAYYKKRKQEIAKKINKYGTPFDI
jgi:radical SAM superfamily enzyme